jgi:hypothetical protein
MLQFEWLVAKFPGRAEQGMVVALTRNFSSEQGIVGWRAAVLEAARRGWLMRRLACTGCGERRNVVAAPSGQRGSPCAGCDLLEEKGVFCFAKWQ